MMSENGLMGLIRDLTSGRALARPSAFSALALSSVQVPAVCVNFVATTRPDIFRWALP
ncbi:protein of unknown function [Pararobbsia alpina]